MQLRGIAYKIFCKIIVITRVESGWTLGGYKVRFTKLKL